MHIPQGSLIRAPSVADTDCKSEFVKASQDDVRSQGHFHGAALNGASKARVATLTRCDSVRVVSWTASDGSPCSMCSLRHLYLRLQKYVELTTVSVGSQYLIETSELSVGRVSAAPSRPWFFGDADH